MNCLFLCHLSLEKALKAIYAFQKDLPPPKTHNLIFLMEESGLKPGKQARKFIKSINDLGIITRYPEELKEFLKLYKRKITSIILNKTKGLLKWLKQELERLPSS